MHACTHVRSHTPTHTLAHVCTLTIRPCMSTQYTYSSTEHPHCYFINTHTHTHATHESTYTYSLQLLSHKHNTHIHTKITHSCTHTHTHTYTHTHAIIRWKTISPVHLCHGSPQYILVHWKGSVKKCPRLLMSLTNAWYIEYIPPSQHLIALPPLVDEMNKSKNPNYTIYSDCARHFWNQGDIYKVVKWFTETGQTIIIIKYKAQNLVHTDYSMHTHTHAGTCTNTTHTGAYWLYTA